jgi:Domain of unknown function (DUF5655)
MPEDALARIESDPVAAAVWDRLRVLLDALPEAEVRVHDPHLHAVRGLIFLGVRPRRGGLLLTVVTEQPLASPRIRRAERASAHRVQKDVLLTVPEEVDDELAGWIEDAYRLADRPAVAG